MDKTSSIQSLTADILAEVDSTEKTAEVKQEFRTDLGKALEKVAEELREFADTDPEISYDDMNTFTQRIRGLV